MFLGTRRHVQVIRIWQLQAAVRIHCQQEIIAALLLAHRGEDHIKRREGGILRAGLNRAVDNRRCTIAKLSPCATALGTPNFRVSLTDRPDRLEKAQQYVGG